VFLSPAQAGAIAQRARKLLRRGQLTHRQLAVLDALLWSCRAPGQPGCRVSYTRLCELTHVSRETMAGAIKRLAELRLIRVTKHTVLAIWANRGRQRLQAVNEYALLPPSNCEFGQPTVLQGQEIKLTEKPSENVLTAQSALAKVRARMEERLLRRVQEVAGCVR
jgi:hypothetical protein